MLSSVGSCNAVQCSLKLFPLSLHAHVPSSSLTPISHPASVRHLSICEYLGAAAWSKFSPTLCYGFSCCSLSPCLSNSWAHSSDHFPFSVPK